MADYAGYLIMSAEAEEKTGELVQLMQVFCPSFFLAVAFTGKSSSALMFYNTILFLIYLVELLVLHFLLPAVKIYGMVRVLSCLTGEDLSQNLQNFWKNVSNGV